MTVTEIISQVLSYTDNIPPTDADYANRRTRLLNYLREVFAEVWYEREWSFARRPATLTVPAGVGYAILPDDFLKLGEYGTVILALPFQQDPLSNVPEHQIVQSRNTTYTTQTPSIFSIFDQEPTTFAPLLQFPMNASDYDVIVSYIKDAPTIDEGANNNKLIQIPVQYHQRVLVPGLQARTLQSKGDGSWNTYNGRFLEALTEMKVQERRRQGTVFQLPSFFGNRGRY